MLKTKILAASAVLAMALGSAGLAHATASLTLNFTLDGSSGGLGVGPFGTVTITEDTDHAGWLDFTVTPGDNWDFHKTQNNGHEAFVGNLGVVGRLGSREKGVGRLRLVRGWI